MRFFWTHALRGSEIFTRSLQLHNQLCQYCSTRLSPTSETDWDETWDYSKIMWEKMAAKELGIEFENRSIPITAGGR